MKNKVTLAAFFSVFLLFSSNVQAVKFDDNKTVDPNKTWTIKFSDDVELDDATKQGITVRDSSGTEVNVGVHLGQDNKTVTVTAPELGYTPGESYMLNIGNKVHSSNGKVLKDEGNVRFCIKNSANSGPIVTFKDKNLEQAIRRKINKSTGDLYESNVDKITQLDIGGSEIEDLSGIEKLVNLRRLDLHGNDISSIDVLKNLTNLKQLTLGNNKISDISVLKNLVNLEILDLGEYYNSENQINNINELNNLTNLKELNLSGNQLKDISALKGLVNLQSIDLSYNEINNIDVIKNLTNLKQLNLANNKISDISALGDLTNLQELNLGYVPWQGIPAPVSKETYNEISDITALKNLTNLQTLNLGYNKVKNTSSLKELSNLQTLDLSNNQISNISDVISALKGLTNFKSLDLSSNQISDISKMNELTNLQTLYLSNNQISDINELKGLINLHELNLTSNKISDISVLKGLTNLKTLDLSYNQISDVSASKSLRDLRWLALFDNPISQDDIQALKNALPSCEINEVVAKKPNIYLYPEKREELTVQVTPKGKITKSIPEYNEGWKVIAEPSGKIDKTYDFLFYEASLNYKFTLNKGWIINKDSFNEEMSSILTSIGLNSKEKADFIEYWSKELKWQSSRYAVYYLDPKEINEAIKLNLSKEPDSILRAYFYFVPLKDNENLEIKKPEIKEFKRNGFTVVEWGGIGK